MNEDYRWFRQDELVRKCVVTNAYFATTAGYETIIETEDPDKYRHVEEKIDELNKTVNMDLALFVAQVKRSVYGKTGFEIVLDEDDCPRQLLPLQSTDLKPDIDENWTLTGYTYKGKKEFYEFGEVLYFTNLQLEADMLSLRPLLHIPYDPDLFAELNVERFELSKTGKILFNHPEGTHDDRFWALALAVYAADMAPPPASRPLAKVL